MHFNKLAMLKKVKECVDRFRANHPKFPLFLKAVSQNALKEGTIIEWNVTTPNGENYCSNLKLTADDMELMEYLKTLMNQSN